MLANWYQRQQVQKRDKIKMWKIHSFTHSFNNYLLSKYMLSIVLPVGDTEQLKIGLTCSWLSIHAHHQGYLRVWSRWGRMYQPVICNVPFNGPCVHTVYCLDYFLENKEVLNKNGKDSLSTYMCQQQATWFIVTIFKQKSS